MVNFNFGLGNSKAQDDTSVAQDTSGATVATDNSAVNPPVATPPVAEQPVAVPAQPVVADNPFVTNIPAAEENVFVTPPASDTVISPEPVVQAVAEPVIPEVSQPINIFENPVPKADEMPMVPTEAVAETTMTPAEPAQTVDNSFAVQTPVETPVAVPVVETAATPEPLAPLEPIFADTPAPVAEPVPQIVPEMPVQPVSEPAPEPEAETADFNPFAADQPSLANDVPVVSEPPKTEAEVAMPEISFNPFAEDAPTDKVPATEPVVTEPVEPAEVAVDMPVEVPVQEVPAENSEVKTETPGLDFNPFAEPEAADETPVLEVGMAETAEEEPVVEMETDELMPIFGNTGDDDDDDDDDDDTNDEEASKEDSVEPRNAQSNDPLQTLTAVKTDIETYIAQQESDISDLNADIDYHKEEIKDLRSQIKDKQKHIKEKKGEFEKMIKDIEKTLATKFAIKK